MYALFNETFSLEIKYYVLYNIYVSITLICLHSAYVHSTGILLCTEPINTSEPYKRRENKMQIRYSRWSSLHPINSNRLSIMETTH